MDELLDTIVVWVFRISLGIAMFVVLYKRIMSPQSINKDLKILLARYFACQFAIFFASHLQMPYRYQLFLEKGLTGSQISEIFAYANIVIAIWNLIMPIALKKLGHATLCTFVALSYCLNSFLISFSDKFYLFVISGCISGLAMPTAMMSLMDYWMSEEMLLPEESNANFVFNEFRVLVALLNSSISSPTSNYIATNYGIKYVFSFTISIPLASIILITSLLHLQKKPEEKSIGGDFSDLKVFFTENPKNIAFVFTEIAFSVVLHSMMQHMSAFLFTPTHKPPMGYVKGAYGVLDLISAQLFSQISGNLSATMWTIVIMISMGLAMSGIVVFYENKIIIFLLLGLVSAIISSANGIFIQMRKLIYPGRIRNYIMTVVKMPSSLISTVIIYFVKDYNVKSYIIVSTVVVAWGAIFAYIIRSFEKTEIITKDQEELLEETKNITVEVDEEEEKKEV